MKVNLTNKISKQILFIKLYLFVKIAIKIIQYDKDDAIKRESIPAFLSFLPGSNYKSSRFTLNTSIFCEIVEGDYITVVAYPAQTASENFTVLIDLANLQINTV